MWCIYRGHICIMVYDKVSGKIRFIREKKWLALSDKEIARFDW